MRLYNSSYMWSPCKNFIKALKLTILLGLVILSPLSAIRKSNNYNPTSDKNSLNLEDESIENVSEILSCKGKAEKNLNNLQDNDLKEARKILSKENLITLAADGNFDWLNHLSEIKELDKVVFDEKKKDALLQYAAYWGNIKATKILIGMEPSSESLKRSLMFAIGKYNSDIAKLLIKENVRLDGNELKCKSNNFYTFYLICLPENDECKDQIKNLIKYQQQDNEALSSRQKEVVPQGQEERKTIDKVEENVTNDVEQGKLAHITSEKANIEQDSSSGDSLVVETGSDLVPEKSEEGDKDVASDEGDFTGALVAEDVVQGQAEESFDEPAVSVVKEVVNPISKTLVAASEDSKVKLVPEKKPEGPEAASIEKGPEVKALPVEPAAPVVRTISKEIIKKLYYESIQNQAIGIQNISKRIFDTRYPKDFYTEEEIKNDAFLTKNGLAEKILSFKE